MADSQQLATNEDQSRSDDVAALESEVAEVLKLEDTTTAVEATAATVEPSMSTEKEEPIATTACQEIQPLEIKDVSTGTATGTTTGEAATEPHPITNEEEEKVKSVQSTESVPTVVPSGETVHSTAETKPTESPATVPLSTPDATTPAVLPSAEVVHSIAEKKPTECPATVPLSTPDATTVAPSTSVENSPEVQSSSVQEGVEVLEQINESTPQEPTPASTEAATVTAAETADAEEQKKPKTPKSSGERKFSFCKTS